MLILDKLITLTIEEVKMYPSVQAKIWGNIGMLQYVCQPLEIACATPHIAYGVRYIYIFQNMTYMFISCIPYSTEGLFVMNIWVGYLSGKYLTVCPESGYKYMYNEKTIHPPKLKISIISVIPDWLTVVHDVQSS